MPNHKNKHVLILALKASPCCYDELSQTLKIWSYFKTNKYYF
jgi:hypothetical protein